MAYALPVEAESSGKEQALARDALRLAAPDAAEKMIRVMHSGDKDDAVQLAAAEKILALNGIAPRKEAAENSAKLVGTAIIAALVGMAKATGVRGVDEKTFRDVLRDATPDPTLPPELAEEQDALT